MNRKPPNISRRSFLGASAAVAAGAAALSMAGCSSWSSLESTNAALPEDLTPEETWISAPCWHNCGGRCMNKVMVKDGAVIRQKTDDTHEDSFDYPQQRGCVRGKAQQQQCFGSDRILHPLKRVNWSAGGGENSNGQLRGRDEWEVISWDEAIDLATSEIQRIYDELGPTGFYSFTTNSWINLASGCVRGWDTMSHGTYTLGCEMIGLPSLDCGETNDRFDLPNAEYIVLYSSNPSWSAPGTPVMNFIRAKEAGTKFYCVDPIYNATAQMLDAEWIPVRCGTDMALLLAVAYEMMRLDDEEGDVVDWDFIHKYTVGFDSESMPADAKLDENLKDYILGAYDGIEKTPEWAERICGTPVDRITELARIFGKNNKTMLLHNYGFARCNGAEMIPQMVVALGVMGAHMGKSGHAWGDNYNENAGNNGDVLVSAGYYTVPYTSNPITTGVRQPQLYELIINGGGEVTDVSNSYAYFHDPVKTTLGPIKAIYHTDDAKLQTSPAQALGIEAHRKVDFVLTLAQFMTTNAKYSDIILPVTTQWERPGSVTSSNREFISCTSQVTEPLGEAKSDQEIGTLILEGLGIDPSKAYSSSETQQFFDQIAGSQVRGSLGAMRPLVTITKDDINKWGVSGSAQEGLITLDEFIENGGYQYERDPDDGYGHIGYEDFINIPLLNPRSSKSGKLEIYCQKRYDFMESFGFEGMENFKPYPTYVVPVIGYETTFSGSDINAEKGDYPYLLFNPHYLRRSHTVFDNCPWLREAWENPVFLNRSDAQEKGIEEGDTVLISTPHGQTLRKAAIMDIIMPGVVGLPHGAWVDVDEETGIDRAGSENYLIGPEYAGMGVSGYNNQNCNIEKYNGEEIDRDCDLAPRWSEE
ncbi:MAG: molybdopterin-dependent oxidoreductase [Eggerthellaceae bacterium]|nr:molybdopterin-dependent oxidoreductase [Eggerthellaceae bacterium]